MVCFAKMIVPEFFVNIKKVTLRFVLRNERLSYTNTTNNRGFFDHIPAILATKSTKGSFGSPATPKTQVLNPFGKACVRANLSGKNDKLRGCSANFVGALSV